MELSDLSEEDGRLYYWNNWSPLSNHSQRETRSFSQVSKKFTKDVVFCSSKSISMVSFAELSKFGNWIPPMNFLDTDFIRVDKIRTQKTNVSTKNNEKINSTHAESEKNNKHTKNFDWRKNLNSDWGSRADLHDTTKFKDDDTIWGVVNLGMFSNIKLWVNEYGNICGLAEGKISKVNSSEVTFICIKSTQLLRKMLCLSSAQWESICETLLEIKTTLKFDAFQDNKMTEKNDLEKLWVLLCKRRHFLPDQCMQVKLCGAVKCMRKFQIIPKLLVQDIRNILGKPVL